MIYRFRNGFFYALIVFSFLFFCSCKGKDRPNQEEQLGMPAPPFILNDIRGVPLSLDNLKGRVVILRFWSTRCESCKVEMPRLERSYRDLFSSGLTVVAVNMEDPPEKVAEFAGELRLTYPILIDEGKKVTKLYQVYGVPTSFLIDRGGVVRERVYGDLTEEAIEKLARPFL